MKIFAAGIATETNTFSPLPTALEDFIVHRGKNVAAGRADHPGLDLSRTWGEQARRAGHEFVFSLNAWAEPSGITVRRAYETLRNEVMTDLKAAMPVDVVLLMLHGAMGAQGYEDCEEDLIRRARAIIGPNAVIGVELDLHCHLSESKIEAADLVITYKEYPHTDVDERAHELFDLAVATKLGRIRPTMALYDCRMVGIYPTSRQPMQAFVEAMKEAEQQESVLFVSFGHGFHFADVPHMGAKMLVVTNNDKPLAERMAHAFGSRLYAIRHEIGFDSMSLPMEEALSKALTSDSTPVVVADQADNTGSGAPGDATFALRWLIEREAKDIALAIFYDPEVVKLARKAGVGATFPIRLGGKLGPSSGHPLDLTVEVLSIRDHYTHALPQSTGAPTLLAVGDFVALRCGAIDLIVSNVRCQCFAPTIFSDFGIDPTSKRVLVVKSMQHFYGAFAPMAGEVIYMAAPGAVSPDPRQISYQRTDVRGCYPWIDDPLEIKEPITN